MFMYTRTTGLFIALKRGAAEFPKVRRAYKIRESIADASELDFVLN